MSLIAWIVILIILGVLVTYTAHAVELFGPPSPPPKHRAGAAPWRSAEPVSLPGDEGWVDEDLELNERIEAEAVAERVIDNLRHIRQDRGVER